VRLAPFQCGENHRFEVTTQFVAVDRFHAFILDRLNPSPIENSGFPREEFSWFQSDLGIGIKVKRFSGDRSRA
jgi:hypothetical protein